MDEHRPHSCHATGCKVLVPPEMLMCRRHWYMVPNYVRGKVRASYRQGQCDDMNPNVEYCLAAKEAVVAVARREGKAPDTRLYDLLIKRATGVEGADEVEGLDIKG